MRKLSYRIENRGDEEKKPWHVEVWHKGHRLSEADFSDFRAAIAIVAITQTKILPLAEAGEVELGESGAPNLNDFTVMDFGPVVNGIKGSKDPLNVQKPVAPGLTPDGGDFSRN